MTYAYFCSCGYEKDDWHNFGEDPKIICDKCGKVMKHRITGGSGISYKGFGWTRSGSKDGTQGHGIHTTETTVAVPVGMEGAVSDKVKKASTVKKQIGSGE
jgi:predicted nucleic acid-binding Zn ribbon protein